MSVSESLETDVSKSALAKLARTLAMDGLVISTFLEPGTESPGAFQERIDVWVLCRASAVAEVSVVQRLSI